MRCKNLVSGAIAGVIVVIPGSWAISQTAGSNLLTAQQEGEMPDPQVEIPEVPSVMDPPETRIPEQMYPCNPGSFQPSEKLAEPNTAGLADDCEGVIPPPPTADTEIDVEPPDPNAGTMPIIKPDEIAPD